MDARIEMIRKPPIPFPSQKRDSNENITKIKETTHLQASLCAVGLLSLAGALLGATLSTDGFALSARHGEKSRKLVARAGTTRQSKSRIGASGWEMGEGRKVAGHALLMDGMKKKSEKPRSICE